MCFRIDSNPANRKPWTQTHAYKVVERDSNGELRSQMYPGKPWVIGKPRNRSKGFTIEERTDWFGKTECSAKAGIYVYRTFAEAREHASYSPHAVVMKVAVDPKNFLYHSMCNEVATYSRVVPVRTY